MGRIAQEHHVHTVTGERNFSCSVCDCQCRRDCDLKPSNDTCVVLSRPVGSSRFHNFYISQLYRAYVTTLSIRLGRVAKRPLQSLHWYNCLLELGSLVTLHVYFNLSTSEVTFDLAWLWKVRGRFTLVRSTLYLHYISSVVYYGTV